MNKFIPNKKTSLFIWLNAICILLFSTNVNAQAVIIGTGASTTSGATADPVERYYNYEHFQMVWTAAELSAAGLPAGAVLTGLGFSISESASSLVNYTISMGHTATATQATANPYTTGLTVVKNPFTYLPIVQAAGSFQMIMFDNNFVWNGNSSICVNTCTGSNVFSAPYGGLRYTAKVNSIGYTRTDGTNNCGNTTNVTQTSNRPNIRFTYIQAGPCNTIVTSNATITSGATNVCAGTAFTLAMQTTNIGNGITYQWESSSNLAFSSPTLLGSASTQLINSQSSSTYYRCLATCASGSVSAYSTPLFITNNAPTPGATIASNNGNTCVGVAFTLSMANPETNSGYTYQWQSASDAAFTTPVTMGSASTQSVASQTVLTYYRCIVSCAGSGLSAISTPVLVSMNNVTSCYCLSIHSAGCTGDAIVSVNLNGWTNNTGVNCPVAPAYSYNFPGISQTTLVQGNSYSLTLVVGNQSSQYQAAWIDFNRDGFFSSTECLGLSGNAGSNGTSIINFSVPLGTATGLTRMRIIGGNDAPVLATQSCGASSDTWGETEDYDISLSLPCPSGPINLGNTLSSANPACTNQAFTLSMLVLAA
jgi:hypothetical protein